MKKFIINKCMNYIKKYKNYSDTKLKEIEYGITGIYLSITKFIIIIALSIAFHIYIETITFVILFNILRSTAFGLHATKSWICLVSSILIFVLIPIISLHITININIKFIICLIQIILMYKNAPADTNKRPIINKKRRLTLKLISTFLTIVFAIFSIFIKQNYISNLLIFSMILENCLISKYAYKLFKLPYNNYITYLKKHPEFINN